MAHRLFGYVALVALGFGIAAAWNEYGQGATSQFTHIGRVVDHDRVKGLVASVTAWPEASRTGMDGSCPIYGKSALDKTTSSPGGGVFKIAIDSKNRTYTIVYCLSDFVPRVDQMPNRKDMTPVEPTPAELWPAKIDTTAAETFDTDIERTLITLLNNLSYLLTVDEKRTTESISRLASDFSDSSPARATAIRSLQNVGFAWRDGRGR